MKKQKNIIPPQENHETHEKIKNPVENNANHENHKIPLQNYKKNKIQDVHARIMKILKIENSI